MNPTDHPTDHHTDPDDPADPEENTFMRDLMATADAMKHLPPTPPAVLAALAAGGVVIHWPWSLGDEQGRGATLGHDGQFTADGAAVAEWGPDTHAPTEGRTDEEAE